MSLFLLVLVIGIVAWTLAERSPAHWSDDPAFRQGLRQSRRERRRQEWATTRQVWRTDLWHRGDGPIMALLLALAAVVIAVCR